jgi:NAD(P)-dependent dehydrogenase (short-subunit alcohol dehydrogenase family)
MSSALAGKSVLVTGASAGIGRATAVALARAGAKIIATGRRTAELDALRAAAPAGSRLDTAVLDVTSAASITQAVAEVERLTGGHGVDVLVNNAGFGLVGPLSEISDAELRRQYDTNVFGLMAVTRAFVPAMQARRAGRVINVSSVGGRMTFPFMGAYNSTKYAVESLSDALRWELRPFNIDVALIEPGVIRTEFADVAMTGTAQYAGSVYGPAIAKADKLRARMEATASGPATVARAIERAISVHRPEPRYIVPRVTWLALLFKSITPSWVWDWTMRRFAFLSLVEAELRKQPVAPAAGAPAKPASGAERVAA